MSRIPDLPRIELAPTPTPIDDLEPLSRELDVGVFVKRDDLTGGALTGNKVRKLEYLLADALEQEADVVLTCGGAYSNHCRATAIAARRTGLEIELFLRGLGDSPIEGNLLLDLLMGAALHHLTPSDWPRRDQMLAQRARELDAEGLRPYTIPEGGSNALGALGSLRCFEEILRDQEESGITFDAVVVPVGSGGTLAGCLAGARLHGFEGRVIGVCVADDAATFQRRVRKILEEMKARWFPDLDPQVPADCLLDGCVGEGYGIASGDDLDRIRDVALITGLVLDPTYTSKAFAGFLALIRDGVIPAGGNGLFLHTGGLLGLFHDQERLVDRWVREA